MSTQSPTAYEANVAISKGVKPITNNGTVTISDGQLSLYRKKGEQVDSAPMAQVYVKKTSASMGAGMSVWVGGTKYMINPGTRQVSWAKRLLSEWFLIFGGRKFTKEFLAAVEANGGTIGKPPKGVEEATA